MAVTKYVYDGDAVLKVTDGASTLAKYTSTAREYAEV